MALASALAAHPAVRSGADVGAFVAIPGVLAVLVLAASVALRTALLLPATLALLLGEYTAFLLLEDGDRLAPLQAAALLLLAELAYWSVEPRGVGRLGSVVLRRGVTLAVLAGAAALLAAFLLGASELGRGGGVPLVALGVGAVVGALALLLVLVLRGRRGERGPGVAR